MKFNAFENFYLYGSLYEKIAYILVDVNSMVTFDGINFIHLLEKYHNKDLLYQVKI